MMSFVVATLFAAAFLVSCGTEKGEGVGENDPNKAPVSSVVIVPGDVTATTISFSLKTTGAIKFYYLVRESAEAAPTVEDLMSSVANEQEAMEVDVEGLKHSSKYVISAVAVNSEDVVSELVTSTMSTISIPIYKEGAFSAEAIYSGGKWWAPVNCGYDKTNYLYGKLYQWGRKDGQGYTSILGKDLGEQANPTVVIMGPLDFTDGKEPEIRQDSRYKCASDDMTKDWINPQVNLWTNGGKSETDPCPNGWRVPTVAEFTALNLSNCKELEYVDANETNMNVAFFGENFESATLEDAKGCLMLHKSGCAYSFGTTSSRGKAGMFWTSEAFASEDLTLAPDESMNLEILKIDEVNMKSSFRVFAMSVRCVKSDI